MSSNKGRVAHINVKKYIEQIIKIDFLQDIMIIRSEDTTE